ncbi:hypothetical protein NliqN6_0871 [Naganishia liquefaciens]|uniref:Protein YOP1 n=1 Tax=Naganishia liquefaciens TaxID=104408 RepID=A0A8H3TQI0_9TREE|nr:hypothetical protein NliqN6_0871 [Naganishia liquefaciens]
MSANTHSNIDASAQRSHETIDSAAQSAHNLASSHPVDRTADAADRTADAAAAKTSQAADKTRDAAATAQAKTQEALAQAQDGARRLSSATSQRVHQLADTAAHHPLVQQTSEASQRQLNALDRELSKYGVLNELETRTGVSKTYSVLGLGGAAALTILTNVFGLAQPVTLLITWVLPTYLSCRALESPQSGDDKQWLTYWIIFGALNLLESIALRVILYYIPQYFTFKLAFLIWLLYPGQNNAQKVYHSVVRPMFQTGRAKAQAVNNTSNTSTYGRTNTLSSPGSANFVNSSTGFSSAGTTGDSSTGYSTATNPFVATSGGGGASGLHTTSAGSASATIPPAAGYPLQ